MAYANATDLASYMQQTLDTGAATLTLQMVSDAMDQAMGLDPDEFGVGSVTVDGNTYTGALLSQDFTDVVLDGPAQGSSMLVLPRLHVSAVSDVQVQDTLGTWTALTYQQDYLWSSAGVLTRIRSSIPMTLAPGQDPGPPLNSIEFVRLDPIWPAIPRGVMVSFTAGLTAVPSSPQGVCLAASARVYANPTGVVGESVGGYSVRYSPRGDGGIGGISFNALELNVLGRYKTVVVG